MHKRRCAITLRQLLSGCWGAVQAASQGKFAQHATGRPHEPAPLLLQLRQRSCWQLCSKRTSREKLRQIHTSKASIRAWPTCSCPVTLGGGMTMVNFSLSESSSGLKKPLPSHQGYLRIAALIPPAMCKWQVWKVHYATCKPVHAKKEGGAFFWTQLGYEGCVPKAGGMKMKQLHAIAANPAQHRIRCSRASIAH